MTPAHRANLRKLKAEFDEAFAAIDDLSDRSSDTFRHAELRYKAWIRAIDAQALALLDDLDAYDLGSGPATASNHAQAARSPVEPVRSSEVSRVFAEMEDLLQAQDIISPGDDPPNLI